MSKLKILRLVLLLILVGSPVYSQFSSRNIINENSGSVRMVRSADFDNDGDMDIVTASFDLIAWYENLDGQGNYGDPIPIQEGMKQSFALCPADFNNDGAIDLVVSYFDEDEIRFYRNLGNGSFSNGIQIDEGLFSASGVSAADIDGDKDLDVIVGVSNGSGLYWLENFSGNGNFAIRKTISATISQARRQAAGDIDGDGDVDILSNSGGSYFLSWFENVDGFGNFGNHHIIDPVGLAESSLHLIDVDGDDDLDIVSQKLNEIIWRENLDGLGNYSNINSISTEVDQVFDTAVGDLDNNGTIDVVSASTDDNKIAWYKNLDGQGAFGAQNIIDPELQSPRTVITTDIDGDGDLDVVSAALSNEGRELVWYENLTILGVADIDTEPEIMVYPNPAKDILHISSNSKVVSKITIFDMQGKQLLTVAAPQSEVNMGHLQSGLYVVQLQIDDAVFYTKILKE